MYQEAMQHNHVRIYYASDNEYKNIYSWKNNQGVLRYMYTAILAIYDLEHSLMLSVSQV